MKPSVVQKFLPASLESRNLLIKQPAEACKTLSVQELFKDLITPQHVLGILCSTETVKPPTHIGNKDIAKLNLFGHNSKHTLYEVYECYIECIPNRGENIGDVGLGFNTCTFHWRYLYFQVEFVRIPDKKNTQSLDDLELFARTARCSRNFMFLRKEACFVSLRQSWLRQSHRHFWVLQSQCKNLPQIKSKDIPLRCTHPSCRLIKFSSPVQTEPTCWPNIIRPCQVHSKCHVG